VTQPSHDPALSGWLSRTGPHDHFLAPHRLAQGKWVPPQQLTREVCWPSGFLHCPMRRKRSLLAYATCAWLDAGAVPFSRRPRLC
jgi:hypothetical protein